MKKLLMMIGAAAVAVVANAETFTYEQTLENGTRTWTYTVIDASAHTAILGVRSAGSKEDGAVVSTKIPNDVINTSEIPWKPVVNSVEWTVTEIGSRAFVLAKDMLKGDLVIPDHVTRINHRAFNNCTYVTSLVLGSGLNTLSGDNSSASYSFSGMSGITNVVVIPKSLTSANTRGPFNAWANSPGGIYVPGPETGTLTLMERGMFSGNVLFETVLFGPNVRLSVQGTGEGLFSSSDDKSISGCTVFLPSAQGTLREESAYNSSSRNKFIRYGAGEALDFEFSDDSITAYPKTEEAFKDVLANAANFKRFGLDTKIAITSRIEMTATITESMLQSVTLETPPWYVTFKVTSQAQLDNVLSAVSADIPIIIDIEGSGKNQITVPEGRKVAILAKSGWTFGKKQNGLVISFY